MRIHDATAEATVNEASRELPEPAGSVGGRTVVLIAPQAASTISRGTPESRTGTAIHSSRGRSVYLTCFL